MAISAERTAVVILAAGLSRRFGDGDKLLAPLHGRPLALNIAETLRNIPFAARFAVIGRNDPGYAACGYRLLHNAEPERGMAQSLKLGVAAAAVTDAQAVLVLLADMPAVPARHIASLLARFDGKPLGSRAGGHISPPALFPRAQFDALMRLEGDAGARALLRDAQAIDAPQAWLADVDTPDDLARLG